MSARISLLTVVVCFLLGANLTSAQTDGPGITLRSERGSYVYITGPPHDATGEPFIGFCDSYFVDLGGLSPRPG